jgi:hypothetical protein
MNLFIDTNIYLTFYHYSSDDLEELKKLAVAIKSGDISLILTQQVKDEFKRNRESKIADALKRFGEQKLGTQFPQLCKEYEEYKELREAIKRYDENRDRIFQKLRSDIQTKSLGADKVISDLFARAKVFENEDKILAAARVRMELGNPPGKDGSYGDAINWETLLRRMPKEELFLITDDKDYMSQVDDTRLAEFLSEEWQERKSAKINFYRKLSDFFRDKFPMIKLASEMEKELAITELTNSGKFERTHLAIAKLSKFTDFTDDEIIEIVEAAISNSQIYWIRADEDVKTFMRNLARGKESIIEAEKLATFKSYYPDEPEHTLTLGSD